MGKNAALLIVCAAVTAAFCVPALRAAQDERAKTGDLIAGAIDTVEKAAQNVSDGNLRLAETAVNILEKDIRLIGKRLNEGMLRDLVCFATSTVTHQEALRLAIPMMDDDLPEDLDVTIDGADEVDPQLDLIKGGGGALLREKIVAQASRREIIVVDESKPSPRLGTHWAVPVEVMPFAWRSQARFLESLGATISIRQAKDGSRYVTDSGNMILDSNFGPIDDVPGLAARLEARAGIVDHGLFIGLATDLIVAGSQGVVHVRRGEPLPGT